jgi:hypothetical protein
MHSQTDVVDLLEKEALQPGDKLEVILDEETKSALLFAILLFLAAGLLGYFYKQQKKEERVAEGGRILEGLAASENAAALEREIEAEYGIQIEFVNEDELTEREDWQRLAMQSLAASYGDDEPDYSDALLLEPNPDYNPS